MHKNYESPKGILLSHSIYLLGPGTTYLFDQTASKSKLLVDNGGASTFTFSGAPVLTTSGMAFLVDSSNYYFDEIIIIGQAKLALNGSISFI